MHLPEGTVYGHAFGIRYIATKTLFNGGKSIKLVAEALDGSDYISLNFYRLGTGDRLRPCEMSDEKVRAFVAAFMPDDLETGA